MIAWRTMRIFFMIPLLMIAAMGAWIYYNGGISPISLPFIPTPTPTRTPAVEGATSIVLPEVNPVLYIAQPSTSMFAPPAPGEIPPQVTPSYLEQFAPDYQEYFRLVELAKKP